MNCEKKYIFIHGLGGFANSFLPLEKYLNHYGISPTFKISYPSKKFKLDELVLLIDEQIGKIANKTDKIVLITQSLGGLLSLKLTNWNIIQNILIVAPLNGACIAQKVKNILPNYMFKKVLPPVVEELIATKSEIPKYKYNTISAAWIGTNFDGRVFKNETILENKHHIHIPYSDHILIFLDPRLFKIVYNLLL